MEIRRVGADDWRVVRRVRLAALWDAPAAFWATYDDEVDKPARWWRSFVASGAWFLALDHGRPAGIAAAAPLPELGPEARQLISMWVAPGFRRRGVALRLVEAVKAWARAEGIQELQLQVADGNVAALRLYERCGFRLTGRTEPLPRDPSVLELEMVLPL